MRAWRAEGVRGGDGGWRDGGSWGGMRENVVDGESANTRWCYGIALHSTPQALDATMIIALKP